MQSTDQQINQRVLPGLDHRFNKSNLGLHIHQCLCFDRFFRKNILLESRMKVRTAVHFICPRLKASWKTRSKRELILSCFELPESKSIEFCSFCKRIGQIVEGKKSSQWKIALTFLGQFRWKIRHAIAERRGKRSRAKKNKSSSVILFNLLSFLTWGKRLCVARKDLMFFS